MATRASVCSALLKRFRSKDDFLRLVTVDKSWVYFYESEDKAQESSVGRVCISETKEVQEITICWQSDGHRILGRKKRYFYYFLLKGCAISGVYYANLLDQLRTVKTPW